MDSRWRRLGSEFSRNGGKGERSLRRRRRRLLSGGSVSTRTSLGFLSTTKRREGRYLGSPSLHFPAPLLLLVFIHLQLGLLESRSEVAGQPRDLLPSIYTPSLHPLASPPPYTQLSAPPRCTANPEPCADLRTRAPVTLQGRSAIFPTLNWCLVAPTLFTNTNKQGAGFPGLAAVRRLSGGKVRANRFPAARCLAPPPDRRRTRTRAAVQASGSLLPLAKVVLRIRCRLKPLSSSAFGRTLPPTLVLLGRVL